MWLQNLWPKERSSSPRTERRDPEQGGILPSGGSVFWISEEFEQEVGLEEDEVTDDSASPESPASVCRRALGPQLP